MRDAGSPITALINAGGQSQRMAASGVALHKALVPVLGVPLIERNLCVLLDQGFRDIVVVVSAKTPDLEAFVRNRATLLAASYGATVECIRETEPLGNMGIAGTIASRAPDFLMTFVDNLTALDLRQVVARHRQIGAPLTIATHREAYQVPHGELQIAGDVVIDYLEKPTKHVRVASGIYVLQARAAAIIPPDRATGAVDLFRLLKDRGENIAAFDHHAPWIDVNDGPAVARADRFVADNAGAFERRNQSPDINDECVLIRTASQILIADRSNGNGSFCGQWDVVRAADAAAERSVKTIIDGAAAARRFLASFDDFADMSGEMVRHDVSLIDAVVGWTSVPDGFAWIAVDGSYGPSELTQPLRRCIAIAKYFS